jgi:hypothetical protein
MEILNPCLSKGKYKRVFDAVAPVGTSSIDARATCKQYQLRVLSAIENVEKTE